MSTLNYSNEMEPPASNRGSSIAMFLVLASLSMLFIAGMVLYLIFRLRGTPGHPPPPAGTIELPFALWISTALMLLSAISAQSALRAIRRGSTGGLKMWTAITAILAVVFVAIQTPALLQLLSSHAEMAQQRILLYAIAAFLLILHAAHVLGGLIALIPLTVMAYQGQFTREEHTTVRNTTLYWHFLDVVWLVMFSVMVILG